MLTDQALSNPALLTSSEIASVGIEPNQAPADSVGVARQVAFVDSRLDNVDDLIASLSAVNVHVIDADQDGVSAIALALAQYDQATIESIHIFSHGSAGALQLGGITLTADGLTGYSEELAAWGDSTSGDILLYGCDVASGEAGASFIEQLALYTGGDILASTDLTGSAALGGDWDLETAVGSIETAVAITREGQLSYYGTLLRNITSNGGGDTATIVKSEGRPFVTDNESFSENGLEEGQDVLYSIDGGVDADKFRIFDRSGVLRFDVAPDFETPLDADGDNIYEVIVKVTDTAGETDTQALFVEVADVDDGPSESTRNITSNGGGDTATIVKSEGRPFVTDNDSFSENGLEEGQDVLYSIDGGVDADKFRIFDRSGVLRFESAPDFETPLDADGDNVYEVNVRVTDTAGETDVQRLSVVVEDIDDGPSSPPLVITSNGGGDNATIDIDENLAVVTDMAATSANGDTESNGLTYRINAGQDADLFEIDANTGVISFKAAPDFETPLDDDGNNTYRLNILAENSAGDTDSQFIVVVVKNVDDNPTATPRNITSNGGGDTATLVKDEGRVFVTDNDSFSDNGLEEGPDVLYTIEGGADADKFQLFGRSGVLRFAATPDFEAPTDADGDNVYEVNVKVTDTAGESDVQQLSVVVEDVDDGPSGPPLVITSNGGGGNATIDLDENIALVTDMAAISANGDTEGNGLTYRINDGQDADLFEIDADTGALSFKVAPDFETPLDDDGNNTYRVNILAENSAGDTDSQFIVVAVKDVVEGASAPTIVSSGGGGSASVSVVENTTFALDIQATDSDGDTEGDGLTYRINAGEDANLFEIDEDTGEVTFKTPPDFETPGDDDGNNVYRINVLVTDSTGQSDSQFIQISVTNEVSVYLLAGQSNMVGVGSDNDDLEDEFANPLPDVQIWKDGSSSFVDLKPGFSGSFGNGFGFGSELGFGFALESARENGDADTEEIYIVKYAVGATNLDVDWNANGGPVYGAFNTVVGNALATLTNAGIGYTVKGMLWMQGENDAFDTQRAATYENNLTTLIGDVRTRYGQGVDFLIGRLHDELPPGFFAAGTVRTAQRNVGNADAQNHWINTDGFEVSDDLVHFTSEGHLDLGEAFADIFID